MNIILYNNFLIENAESSISDFLKTQYNHIFPDPTQSLNNLFSDFNKKLYTEKNISNLYQMYLKSSQTLTQNEINNATDIIGVDKILTESIKYFYFSLKPIINKLQNDQFTVTEIFGRSRDKRLATLMSYSEDQFTNAAATYASTVITEIKTSAGINSNTGTTTTNTTSVNPNTSTNTTTVIQTTSESITDRINYKINRILEADNIVNNTNLINYKKSAINWINISLFDMIKPKIQLLSQISANTSNSVDQLSTQMKGTTNENAKKIILNKILNMNKEELQTLVNTLGLTKEQLGDL